MAAVEQAFQDVKNREPAQQSNIVVTEVLKNMLEASKLVLVNDPDFEGGLHKIARLYHHDLETNEASLLVDKLRIHELQSASVIAMG